jgi:hypothetical protein
MKKVLKFNIGYLTYNEQHGFFWGRINGRKVTMNQFKDKDGKDQWSIQEELEVFETEPKERKAQGFPEAAPF